MPRPSTTAIALWLRRFRFVTGVAICWAVLHYGVGSLALPCGYRQPPLLAAAPSPVLAAVALLVLLAAGSLVGAVIVGRRNPAGVLLVGGLGLALWAAPGGNMDDWLKLANTVPGRATLGPYWPLALDYVVLFVSLAAAALAVTLARPPGAPGPQSWTQRVTRALPQGSEPAHSVPRGIAALVTCTAVAAVLVWVLTGPRAQWTRTGQVYFAVLVAFAVGVIAARQLTHVEHPLWYVAAPFVVGLGGLVWTMTTGPSLPAPYDHLNIIPANGLVRALPVQLVGVGLTAVLWIADGARGEPRPGTETS